MANLPWSVKAAAAIAGLSGSKEKGLAYLRAVAKGDVQAVVAAMAKASQQSIARLTTDVTKFVQVNGVAPVSSAGTPKR